MRAKLFALAATFATGLALSWLAAVPQGAAQSCPATQSTPGFAVGGNVFGRIAAQWNTYFAAKVDTNNGVLCNPTILGTLNITAGIIVNALGYTPLATDGYNAASPFIVSTHTGFGIPRNRAPRGVVEVLDPVTDHPLVLSTSLNTLGQLTGTSYFLHTSGDTAVEYGYVGTTILDNDTTNFDGEVVLYAAKNGTRTEYLRAGNGGACVAEGSTFCALTAPPQDGIVTKGGIRTPPISEASLGACNVGAEGTSVPINNSNTATFNATITTTGSNHGIAYCNGSNWVFR